jgi:hypothetical protein
MMQSVKVGYCFTDSESSFRLQNVASYRDGDYYTFEMAVFNGNNACSDSTPAFNKAVLLYTIPRTCGKMIYTNDGPGYNFVHVTSSLSNSFPEAPLGWLVSG